MQRNAPKTEQQPYRERGAPFCCETAKVVKCMSGTVLSKSPRQDLHFSKLATSICRKLAKSIFEHACSCRLLQEACGAEGAANLMLFRDAQL